MVNQRGLWVKKIEVTYYHKYRDDNLGNLRPWMNIGGVRADIGSLHQLLALTQWLNL